jgi:hypothetical protein
MAIAPTDIGPADDLPHPGATIEEWLFAAWTDDASIGVVSGHRLIAGRAWYWSALVELGQPLLHLAEWDVVVRADPFVVKAPEMWAEHHCVSRLEQWSIGNEAYFVALDDPAAALDRAYGVPTPTAMDLEWYAVGSPQPVPDGFVQRGVVHGRLEVLRRSDVDLAEVPAVRWRRWTTGGRLDPVVLPEVFAHTGLRAPFAFPDGTVTDWVLTRSGWCSRAAAAHPHARPPTAR